MKGKHTRSVAKELVMQHPENFSEKFDDNKDAIANVKMPNGAKMLNGMKDERNMLAGEITNQMKRRNKKED